MSTVYTLGFWEAPKEASEETVKSETPCQSATRSSRTRSTHGLPPPPHTSQHHGNHTAPRLSVIEAWEATESTGRPSPQTGSVTLRSRWPTDEPYRSASRTEVSEDGTIRGHAVEED